jgi:tetratricopeptide (TPR) repeat protein
MDRSVLTDWERLIAAGSACERAKEYGKAAEHYGAAAKLAERSGPSDNVYLGRALFRLAWVRNRDAGGTADTSLYTRALAILEENLEYPGVVSGLAGEMTVWCSQKDYAEAERLGKRFLPAVERTHGLLHEDTTKLVLKLGHALGLQHKHAEADQLYERWLQAAEAAGGDDLRVIRVITDMARNFRSAGSTSRAQSMYSRALILSESLPGDAPQEVLLELGTLYGAQGRYEEAEKLLRRCWSKAYPSDTEVAEALADVLRRTGREKEAGEIEEHARRHQWYMDV